MVTNILARIRRIDTLIREGNTGTPAQLARTIGVSVRTLYQYIKQMKQAGAPIQFNQLTKSYYYREDGRFNCGFSFVADDNATGSKLSVKTMKEYIDMMNRQMVINYN